MVTALVVVSALLGTVTAAAAPSGTGSISGRVVDGNGNPLSGICVGVQAGPEVQSDGSGAYAITGLATGGYKVGFRDCNGSPQYVTQWYLAHADANSADVLPVTDGVDLPLPDVTLARGASVTGTVTDSSGAPLADICVDANIPSNGGYSWIGGSVTGPAGTYTIGLLPATDVRIHFRDCAQRNYLDQWYDGQANPDSSTPLVLAPEEDRQNVNAQLGQGVVVAGRVTDPQGNPIAGINVNVNPTDSGSNAWGQTDSSGRYTTSALPVGTYRVQFQDSGSNPVWAGQFWNGKPSRNLATVLTIGAGNGPVRSNVNATLTPAASISGTVTAPNGGPAANVCAIALVDTPDGPDWLGSATTASDGTYVIGGLPAITIGVYFSDCNGVGPYVEHFWKNSRDFEGATLLTLNAGARRSGVDTRMDRAAVIAGTVTDLGGHPLGGMCAQATTDSFFGGMARTQSDGRYQINLARSGAYKVQFVDCSGSPQFAGEWWDDQPTAATARTVSIGAGQSVGHVDAALAPGAVGTISGRVVNVNGTPMTTACVVAYVPNQFAQFAPVNADGTYTLAGLPSGTYSVAFLGCGDGGDPGVQVPDPESSGTSYQAVWWNGPPVALQSGEGGPDPIAQRASLVALRPGQHLTGYDWCFGCAAIRITSITPGNGTLTVAFTTSMLLAAGDAGAVGPAAARMYTVTCTSSTGGATGVATGPSSPIMVTGITPGATYTCQVEAADGNITVASSAVSGAVVSETNGADPAAGTVPFPVAAAGGEMARTGTNAGTPALLGAALLALGLALVTMTRRRRPVARRSL